MRKTIVFIHGAWRTAEFWGNFRTYFAQPGDGCIAPKCPDRDPSVAELRENPPSEFARIGVKAVTDDDHAIGEKLPEPRSRAGIRRRHA